MLTIGSALMNETHPNKMITIDNAIILYASTKLHSISLTETEIINFKCKV